LGVVESGVGDLVPQPTFSLSGVAGEGVVVGAAPTTGGYGARAGQDQLLAAVALEGNVRRMSLVNAAKCDFMSLVMRFNALDSTSHLLTPSDRPTHPVKARERHLSVADAIIVTKPNI
jgi:hypothetical protein